MISDDFVPDRTAPNPSVVVAKDVEAWPLCHSAHDKSVQPAGAFAAWELVVETILELRELRPLHLRADGCRGCSKAEHDYLFFYKAPRLRRLRGGAGLDVCATFAGALLFLLPQRITESQLAEAAPFDTGCLIYTGAAVAQEAGLRRERFVARQIARSSLPVVNLARAAAKYISLFFETRRAYWLGDPLPQEQPPLPPAFDWTPLNKGDKLLWTIEVRVKESVSLENCLVAMLLNWCSVEKERELRTLAGEIAGREVIVRVGFTAYAPADLPGGEALGDTFERQATDLYEDLVDYAI